jgi:hypothetical protein
MGRQRRVLRQFAPAGRVASIRCRECLCIANLDGAAS